MFLFPGMREADLSAYFQIQRRWLAVCNPQLSLSAEGNSPTDLSCFIHFVCFTVIDISIIIIIIMSSGPLNLSQEFEEE